MLTKSAKPICTLPLLILAVIISKACPWNKSRLLHLLRISSGENNQKSKRNDPSKISLVPAEGALEILGAWAWGFFYFCKPDICANQFFCFSINIYSVGNFLPHYTTCLFFVMVTEKSRGTRIRNKSRNTHRLAYENWQILISKF